MGRKILAVLLVSVCALSLAASPAAARFNCSPAPDARLFFVVTSPWTFNCRLNWWDMARFPRVWPGQTPWYWSPYIWLTTKH